MVSLRRLYGKLRLTVNETKSALAKAFDRKFLGYAFWVAPRGVIKRKVAKKPLAAGRLRSYVLGWKAYFRLAQTPGVFKELEKWMRHRLRAVQLKQWKRGKTIYRELTALGAPVDVARRVAAGSRHWWRNSIGTVNAVLTLK